MIKNIKFLILFFGILTAILPINNNANANMFNKFRDGFYFEKYDTAEEAKAALLELHPIGSDVGELVGTLEGAGAIEDTPKSKKDNGGWDHIIIDKRKVLVGNFLFFHYSHRKFFIFPTTWTVIIEFDQINFTKITAISVRSAVDSL